MEILGFKNPFSPFGDRGVWLTNLIWFRPFNIRHFYDRTFVKFALQSPETSTQLGIPVLYDWTKDEWDDVSDARLWKNFQQSKEDYTTLLSYDFDKQSPANQLNTKILRTFVKSGIDGEPFFYNDYPVNQFYGIQSDMPNLIANYHKLNSKSDIKAYIARLEGFETKFDQVLEGLKIREQKGIIPPKFVIKRVLDEMKGFVGTGVEKNILYTSFTDKVSKVEGLSEEEKSDFTQQVARTINNSVFQVYQKLIDYHEGIPGHHFQMAIAMELKGLPVFRTVVPFTAYMEGWALYTEQLAYELGLYNNDPFGNLGRLQEELFRACRLVVDAGIHYKKWTREEAILYMVNHTGFSDSQVITEVERYIVMPGQACAYKIGMMKILELREKAKQALGPKFDLREFHRVVLENGSVPLDILEEIVGNYIHKK